ncbi:MAG: Crp/Fnr family transcriptional regulator, partial [Acidimicrobiales bacterium]
MRGFDGAGRDRAAGGFLLCHTGRGGHMDTTATPEQRAQSHQHINAPDQRRSAGPCRFLMARPNAQDVERLAAGGESRRVKRGTRVFAEGDAVDAVYVIRRGRVALGRTVRGRNVTLLLLREGDILGDIPMLLRTPAPFDAVATTDVELVAIPSGRLVATLDKSPEFARRWVLWLSGRLSNT